MKSRKLNICVAMSAACFCLCMVVPEALIAGGPWFVAYEKALKAQERGEWQTSITYLRESIAEKDKPKLKAKTYGLRFVNYFPYYYLGVAYYHLDDKKKAIENFDIDQKYGEIFKADEYAMLRKLKAELTGEKYEPPVADVTGSIDSVDRRATLEGEQIEHLPWYVNYETALAYVESGDWFKAIENLKWAVASKGAPKRYARTYGMWFISYLPYYYLGVAYYNQGLWQFAINYLGTSERLGETKDLPTEDEYLHRLMTDAKTKNAKVKKAPVTEEVRELLNLEIADAVNLFNQEEYAESQAKFRAVLQLDPYNSIAKSYLKKLKTPAPQKKSSRAGSNDYLAGTFELFKGRYDKAVELLKAAQDEFDQDATFHAYLGAAYSSRYHSSGKSDRTSFMNAQQEFARTLELNPAFQLDNRVFSNDVIELFQMVRKSEQKN